jgi:hypothetical protein
VIEGKQGDELCAPAFDLRGEWWLNDGDEARLNDLGR